MNAWNFPVLQALFANETVFGSAFSWHIMNNNKQHNFQKVLTVEGCSLPFCQHYSFIFQISSESWCHEVQVECKSFCLFLDCATLLMPYCSCNLNSIFIGIFSDRDQKSVSGKLRYTVSFRQDILKTALDFFYLLVGNNFQMQLYGKIIKRTNYFFPLSLLATFNSKGGCMLPESSHSSPVLQGLCILLWNARRPFFYGTPTPCERKEGSAI